MRAVNSAASAREAVQIRRPDLILADVGMPDEDGHLAKPVDTDRLVRSITELMPRRWRDG